MKYVLLFIVFFVLVSGKAQNTLTPEKLWEMKRISGGSVSPDGRFLLFSQRVFDVANNKGNTDLFVIDLNDNSIVQVTKTSFSEFEAQWGKNNFIWFLSTESDGTQVWRMNVDGSGKIRCSKFEDIEIEGFKISPDEQMILTIETVRSRPTVNQIYSDLPFANARIEDDLMYRHWDHYDDFKKRHLFTHSIKYTNDIPTIDNESQDILDGEPFDGILPPMGGSEQFCFSQDSKSIIYTAKKMLGKDFALHTNSDLYQFDLANNSTQNITSEHKGYDINPAFSNDGQLAWLSMKRDGFESDKNNLLVQKNGKVQNLTESIDLSVTDFCWHPDGKKLFFLAAINGTVQLFEVDNSIGKFGELKQLTTGQFDVVSLAFSNNQLFFGRQSMIQPTELFALDLTSKKITQLTNVNGELLSKLNMPSVQEKWVETTDGKKMLVWMVLPPNFDASKKYPTLLYCQGGPQSPVSQFFSYRWNLALMASNGYIVVAPNRRGLPGFGQEWNDAISKDWGGQAMQDYLSAIDYATTLNYVDADKLGAVGASYGGYSVYMLAGIHQKRFKTFVAHCGLFNLESWYGTTEELFFANWDHGGPYWLEENKENYLKNSPHKYVQNWDTPILVIHGGLDYRVPESEGMQAFQAAQLQGLKSRYLNFPTEGHWVQSPQNSLLWQREFFRWLAEDLKP
jgi:dipeptidyl aminopeptidase/acylaminoacyl peptidase